MLKYSSTLFLGTKLPVLGPLIFIFSTCMLLAIVAPEGVAVIREIPEVVQPDGPVEIEYTEPTGPWVDVTRAFLEGFRDGVVPNPGSGPGPNDGGNIPGFFLITGLIRDLLAAIVATGTFILINNDFHFALDVANKIHDIIPGAINVFSNNNLSWANPILEEVINLATQIQIIFNHAESSGLSISDNSELVLTLKTILKELFVKLGTIYSNMLYDGAMASNLSVLRDNVVMNLPDNIEGIRLFLGDFFSSQ